MSLDSLLTDFNPAALSALFQVVMIDLTLAGDNAMVVGMAAARLPKEQRRRAITTGVVIAMVLRILLAFVAVKLLLIVGLTLAGGLLLLWVAWKSFREFRAQNHEAMPDADAPQSPGAGVSYRQAMIKIVIADVSMSLDNVFAVAGTARDHVAVLVLGLVLSIALMGVASAAVARLMARAPWLVWLGIAIVTYVALEMIWDGYWQVHHHLAG
ncbi:MAG TPA: YjbE family putative metal transport protein [Stellaceae bacterium]|nr:YjbE family putative metal transport protein [Stellaceae bacterium]